LGIIALTSFSFTQKKALTNNNTSIHSKKSFRYNSLDSCNNTSFNYEDFSIKILTYNDLPYVSHLKDVFHKKIYDKDSVPIHVYHKQKNYHLVFIAQYTLQIIDVYNETTETRYLDHIEQIADKLINISNRSNSTIFFPYSFDFPLHGNAKETMIVPWYSGMAQGQILSVFCRLYEITDNIKYLNYSKKIFNSFTKFKGNNYNPWVSCINKNGNLWLEEYPQETPCFTLNGMIFAIYGIYDYYRITKDKEAERYLKAAITTIKVNISKYRNSNTISSYCLKHRVKNLPYHNIHIKQLATLYKITGDTCFKDMSEKFKEDTRKK
jgi:rhamnogalacturonyl hydrolase YesR